MWVFIIDTNAYAGNFERAMGAFVTGHVGDCGTGRELAEEAIIILFEDYIGGERDEYGWNQHARMEPTPFRRNNGYGKHYSVATEPAPDDDKGCSAYESVGILLEERPTAELLQLMRERAQQFTQLPRYQEIKITGFRLVREEIVTTPEESWSAETTKGANDADNPD